MHLVTVVVIVSSRIPKLKLALLKNNRIAYIVLVRAVALITMLIVNNN